jgi:hypothetical protein
MARISRRVEVVATPKWSRGDIDGDGDSRSGCVFTFLWPDGWDLVASLRLAGFAFALCICLFVSLMLL